METKSGEIILDLVGMERFRQLNYASSCEDCTHFDLATEKCTFGFPTQPHLKRNQIQQIQENGKMAFCRSMEID